jgi:hypothetical protein
VDLEDVIDESKDASKGSRAGLGGHDGQGIGSQFGRYSARAPRVPFFDIQRERAGMALLSAGRGTIPQVVRSQPGSRL